MRKNKASYSIPSNLRFVIKTLSGWDKKALIINAALSPCGIILMLLTTYVAPVLLYLVEKKFSLKFIVAAVVALTVMTIALNVAVNRLSRLAALKMEENGQRFNLLFTEKVISMDYELIEGPVGRTKFEKAKTSLNRGGVGSYISRFIDFLSSLLGIVSVCAIICYISPWVILALFAVQGLLMLTNLFEQKLENKGKDERAAIDRRLNTVSKNARDFAFAKDIRLYSVQSSLRKISEHYIELKRQSHYHVYNIYFASDIAAAVIALCLKGGAYGFVIYRVMRTGMAASEVLLFATAVLSFDSWLESVTSSFSDFSSANHCISDMREFLNLKDSMTVSGGSKLPARDRLPAAIEIKDLTFSYPGSERRVLDHINLRIEPGEKIAVVGVNGAGKTTLVKLLCGLYGSRDGQVLLDGKDLLDYNRDELYTLFSIVFQDVRVMPLSVKQNISMATDDETDSPRVEECLWLAGLTDKVKSLGNGMETMLVKNVNEDGAELSGGELQKLMLARALYKDSPYIILDEPTAALDPIAETEMYLRYHELTKNKTAVYISHRLSSTRFCDRIIFLSDGEIAEVGSHDELMRQNGQYADMFRLQSHYYQEMKEATAV